MALGAVVAAKVCRKGGIRIVTADFPVKARASLKFNRDNDFSGVTATPDWHKYRPVNRVANRDAWGD